MPATLARTPRQRGARFKGVMFIVDMRVKIFLSITLVFQVNSVYASDFEFCTFSGLVTEVSDTDNPEHTKGFMKIRNAKRSNDLGYTDCQDFIGQEHRFLFSAKENAISKGSFVELNYRYWEDINGLANENWEVVKTDK